MTKKSFHTQGSKAAAAAVLPPVATAASSLPVSWPSVAGGLQAALHGAMSLCAYVFRL